MHRFGQVFRVVPLLALLASCSAGVQDYTLAGGKAGSPYHETAQAVARLWEQEGGSYCIDAKGDSLANPVANCFALATQQVDFALIADDASLDQCIDPNDPEHRMRLRVIAPLYPEVLFLIHDSSLSAKTVKELVRNRRVGLGPQGGHSALFAEKVLDDFSGGRGIYQPVFCRLDSLQLSPQLPVVALLTTLNDPVVARLLAQGGRIFSLDDPDRYGQGSRVEGFAARYVHTHPYLLAAGGLGSQPTEPVLTLAVDILLATRMEVPDQTVLELTSLLFEHQQDLVNQSHLFYDLSEDFDRRTLEFPLHPGAIQYYERDSPTFLERYAEVIALLVTLAVMLYGGITGVSRWLAQRKKDRIDAFYVQVLDIEQRGRSATTHAELDALVEELLSVKEEAVRRLVDEKLAADDAFRIFESLAANNLTTLRYRQERLAQGE